MTAITFPREREPSLGGFLSDCAVMTRRNLTTLIRIPQLLLGATVQPIMFVLLFAYVFGPAISAGNPAINYKQYLLPGIMGQTIAFSAFIVALGLTNDLEKGIIDRFRSLPISRSSVLIGRSIASVIHSRRPDVYTRRGAKELVAAYYAGIGEDPE